jgi:diguanylate cyclase (GGDEF)-like protein
MRSQPPGAKSARVLVVGDDAATRSCGRAALEGIGAEVEEAADAEQARRALAQRPVDLVLIDVEVPGGGGFDLCEAIRGGGNLDLPVVLMTGSEDLAAIRRAYEVGATDFVTKPVPWLVLAQRVRHLLRTTADLAELRRSRERLAIAQRLARMANLEVDLVTGDLLGSEELRALFGLAAHENLSVRTLEAKVDADDREALYGVLCPPESADEVASIQLRVPGGDAGARILELQGRIRRDREGRRVALDLSVQDVTAARRADTQIRHLAYHDALTGLDNRVRFRDRLERAIARAAGSEAQLAVLFLDLDRFKRINDTLGHSMGDTLLASVADRLRQTVRMTDVVGRPRDSDHAISRLGGDEFTLLLTDVANIADVARVARRVLAALSDPFDIAGHSVVIGASVGIALYPEDGADAEALLRNADAAMYHAKDKGRNNFQFYSPAMNKAALRRLVLEEKLRHAIDAQEFELAFQPRVSLLDRRITGFEVLLRWRDPERGLVLPGEFIGVAEESGLIVPIGTWVLHSACKTIEEWRVLGLPRVPLAVNVSAKQFRREGVISDVRAALRNAGADPQLLEIEITESTLAAGEGVSRALGELRRRGMRIAIDDFGTGYSCLGYLRRLPVDTLKIDRVFVSGIETNEDDRALTQSIVSMAHALRLRVVAEGVETDAQRAQLAAWGCDEIQGYLISRPIAQGEVPALWRRLAPGQLASAR